MKQFGSILAISILFCGMAHGAPAWVQSAGSAADSVSVAVSIAPAAAHTLTVAIATANNSGFSLVSGVTDNASGGSSTYTMRSHDWPSFPITAPNIEVWSTD